MYEKEISVIVWPPRSQEESVSLMSHITKYDPYLVILDDSDVRGVLHYRRAGFASLLYTIDPFTNSLTKFMDINSTLLQVGAISDNNIQYFRIVNFCNYLINKNDIRNLRYSLIIVLFYSAILLFKENVSV